MDELAAAGKDRQETQRVLVERAQKIPGVADAFEVYKSVAGRSVATVPVPAPPRYATGANA